MTPDQEQEIINLRSRNLTPKQIARKLGLRVSEVTAVIKAQAEQAALIAAESGELAPIARCLVSRNCAQALLNLETDDDTEEEEEFLLDEESLRGLGIVLVIRSPKFDRFTVASYMVDYWCLGVKDCIEPRQFNRADLNEFIEAAYSHQPEGYYEITLQQAQAIVYGAIDYARTLGFEPHRDFEQAREHLGEWNGEPKLEFGRDGKPFYFCGPYDNSQEVIRTLRKTVGDGNFDYVIEAF